MDFDVQKTKSHSNQSAVKKRAGMLKVCAREQQMATLVVLGGHPQVATGQPGCLVPAPLAPVPSQWSQTQVRHELGPTGQVGTEAGVLRWKRSTTGGRSGCAGPSGLTREGKALLPHKGEVRPLAGPVEQAGLAGASMRALGSREHSRLGPSAHRTQGGQSGKSQGQHPGFWRIGPWAAPPAP